jgi:hypothetical protein
MLLREWKMEEALAVSKEEGREEVRGEERAEVLQMIAKGMSLEDIERILRERSGI